MDRATFASLPVGIALGLLYDANPALASVQASELARPPRYDGRLYRREGFVWMSEMLLNDLRWWYTKKSESARAGTKYSPRDGKTAETLAKWIAWREQCPGDLWVGIRGDEQVTAAAPSRSPILRSGDARPTQPQEQTDEFPDSGSSDNDIPW